MLVVAVVGGIASGKSFVSSCFQQLGAMVLDADRIGHEVLREPEIVAQAVRRWGGEILGADGQVDRKALAAIVFAPAPAGPPELLTLEQWTHPRIAARLTTAIERYRQTQETPMVVLDAPVLFKAGWESWCDQIVYVEVPREIRWKRVQQRGWTESQFDQRERAQVPLSESRQRATCVIDNGGSPEATWAAVRQLWNQWIPLTTET